MRHFRIFGLAALAVFAFLASPSIAATRTKIPAYITAAVDNPNRPDTDKKHDADRKPAETIAFAGVKSGDHIVELMPGRGYYTKILSKVVGPKGWVYGFFPSALNDLLKKNNIPVPPPDDPNYPNVSYLDMPLDKLVVPERVDLVWTSQNYHDVVKIDQAVYDALKPGGIYLVLDHIDPEAVKKEVESAGFKLVAFDPAIRGHTDQFIFKFTKP